MNNQKDETIKSSEEKNNNEMDKESFSFDYSDDYEFELPSEFKISNSCLEVITEVGQDRKVTFDTSRNEYIEFDRSLRSEDLTESDLTMFNQEIYSEDDSLQISDSFVEQTKESEMQNHEVNDILQISDIIVEQTKECENVLHNEDISIFDKTTEHLNNNADLHDKFTNDSKNDYTLEEATDRKDILKTAKIYSDESLINVDVQETLFSEDDQNTCFTYKNQTLSEQLTREDAVIKNSEDLNDRIIKDLHELTISDTKQTSKTDISNNQLSCESTLGAMIRSEENHNYDSKFEGSIGTEKNIIDSIMKSQSLSGENFNSENIVEHTKPKNPLKQNKLKNVIELFENKGDVSYDIKRNTNMKSNDLNNMTRSKDSSVSEVKSLFESEHSNYKNQQDNLLLSNQIIFDEQESLGTDKNVFSDLLMYAAKSNHIIKPEAKKDDEIICKPNKISNIVVSEAIPSIRNNPFMMRDRQSESK